MGKTSEELSLGKETATALISQKNVGVICRQINSIKYKNVNLFQARCLVTLEKIKDLPISVLMSCDCVFLKYLSFSDGIKSIL